MINDILLQLMRKLSVLKIYSVAFTVPVFIHFCQQKSSIMSSPSQSRPSTPSNPLTSFNEAVFTDSPVDFNAVKQAIDALNTLLDSGEPLPTPTKTKCRSRHKVTHESSCT